MAAVCGDRHLFCEANSAFCRLLKRSPGEILGQPFAGLFPEQEEWTALLNRVQGTGQAASHTHIEHAGGPTTFRSATAWPAGSGEVLGWVMIQVTETVAFHEQLVDVNEALVLGAMRHAEQAENARKEAEAASRAKDSFMAVLSHELRTPLTPILMAVRMLLRTKDLPLAIADGLAMIERNVRFEGQLIDEMLDFTSINRGKLTLAPESIDLRAVLRHAVEIIAPDIEEKHQRLNLALDAAGEGLFGDTRRLVQVFTNLLRNASKFTPQDGDIWLRSRAGPGRVTVEVADTGIGFPTEAIERIFDAFSQASDEVTRQFGGLGLGLAIARAIIQAHGGTLRGSSPGAGQGATFTVELPLPPAD
jgi:signal transduction histidine kinase